MLLVVAALLVLPVSPAQAVPSISRDEIISIAQSGVGCPYVWGGACWDPNNKSWKGADCSGYVTKCWQIPTASSVTSCGSHPYSTSTFRFSNTHWSNISRDAMIRGDAMVYNNGSNGHIVIYESGDKWGAAQVYEARGSAYGIVHRTKTAGSEYVARRRDGLVDPTSSNPPPPSEPPPSNPPPPPSEPPPQEPPPSNPPPPPPSEPPPAYYPQMNIAAMILNIPQQQNDFCIQGTSQGVFDWFKGQETEVHVEVKNLGTAVANNVKIGLSVEEPFVRVVKWNIYAYTNGSFNLSDTDSMQGVSHDNPPSSFTLWLGPLHNGETRRIALRLQATATSFGATDHADVLAWIANVAEFYNKPDYNSPPSNTANYQTQNGGDLKVAVQTDVLEQETCDGRDNDCDGQIDEENICANGPGANGPDNGGGFVSDPLPGQGGSSASGLTGSSGDQLYGGCSLRSGDPAAASWPVLLVLLGWVVLTQRKRGRGA